MLIDFRQLFPKYKIKPSGVLHLGANVGEEALVYDELGIKEVVWIEGNPKIFDILKQNISKYPGQRAFNCCVGNQNKDSVVLHISNNGSQSSSVLELGTHKTAHPDVHYIEDVNVEMVRVADLFANYDKDPDYDISRLNFLNLDLQGYELEALRGMGDLLHQFSWVYSEVNQAELYKGCPLVQDLDLFLNGFGFKRVETKWCGNFGWGDALYIKGR